MEDFSGSQRAGVDSEGAVLFRFGPSLRASLQLQQDLLWSSQCNRAAYGERPAHPCYCGGELSPDSADLSDGAALLAKKKTKQSGYADHYTNIALQARVKLYMEDYDGALNAAREIIESGVQTV